MRRLVLIAPGLLGPGADLLPPDFRRFILQSRVRRLSALPERVIPEAGWFTLPPSKGRIAAGPLVVAALGAEPPLRSTHFWNSLGAVEGNAVVETTPPTVEELKVIAGLYPKLNTKRLTGLWGQGTDHALVWEDWGDLATTPLAEAVSKPLRDVLPEGDAEPLLRQYIEDSVNMLSELDFNRKRRDEEKPPLNLIWPWGHGTRPELPNLGLALGEVVNVESGSLRLSGLAKLTGLRHGSLGRYGSGTGTRWSALAQAADTDTATIVQLEGLEGLDEEGRAWAIRAFEREFLAPWSQTPGRLLVLVPHGDGGLLLEGGSGIRDDRQIPFRLEVLEDDSVEAFDSSDVVGRFLATDRQDSV